jgi:hypothetical protein
VKIKNSVNSADVDIFCFSEYEVSAVSKKLDKFSGHIMFHILGGKLRNFDVPRG